MIIHSNNELAHLISKNPASYFRMAVKAYRYNNDTPSQGDIFSEVSKTGSFLQ
jgi:hypothetical protein